MRSGTSRIFGLVISDIGNPFFTAVARGAEDVAQRHGYSLVLSNTDENPEREAATPGRHGRRASRRHHHRDHQRERRRAPAVGRDGHGHRGHRPPHQGMPTDSVSSTTRAPPTRR